MSTGRVYLYLGEGYQEYEEYLKFDTLIEAVAHSNPCVNGRTLLNSRDQTVCERNTKRYIAREATKLIRKMTPIVDNNHMALHASKRQINNLIKVLECNGNSLSCYSLVILHIIYISIDNCERDKHRDELNRLNKLIYQIANDILYDYCDNIIAHYLLDCHPVLDKEMNESIIAKADDFPAPHRWFA